MASAGSSFHHMIVVDSSVEDASVFLQKYVSGIKGYSVERNTDGSITLRHRFIPNWALLVALVGLFAFLLGLLALFVKDTETGTILFSSDENGTRVTASGTVSTDMRHRLSEGLQVMVQRWPARSIPDNDYPDQVSASPNIPTTSQYEQLLRIAELRDRGVLTSEEFEVGKRQIIDG